MSVVINGSAGVTTNTGAVYDSIQSGTAVASTSGTSIDFTSIPSWVKRITVMFSGVSTSGTSFVQIQIGSGSFTTSGYQSTASLNGLDETLTTGFWGCWRGDAANVINGAIQIFTVGSGNKYVNTGITSAASGATSAAMFTGAVTLSGVLDRVRITTVGGSDTFDAGSINILYE